MTERNRYKQVGRKSTREIFLNLKKADADK